MEEKAWKGASQTDRKGRDMQHLSTPATPAAHTRRTGPEVLPVPLRNSDSADALAPELLSQCQNLTLYQSFCAMKYAIYALCVNSHQHTPCQECKDSSSEDLAAATEPVNESVSSSGTAPPPSLIRAGNLFQRFLYVGTPSHQDWGSGPWFYSAQE